MCIYVCMCIYVLHMYKNFAYIHPSVKIQVKRQHELELKSVILKTNNIYSNLLLSIT